MQTPQILRELDQLARASKWPDDELARRLNLDRTTLANLRVNRKRISLSILSQILVTFAAVPSVPGLVLHYLGVELRERKWGMLPVATPSAKVVRLREGLPNALVTEITDYAVKFPALALEAQGLYLTGADTDLLSDSVECLLAEFEQRAVFVMRMRAHETPSASHQQDALAAPLLVVERIDGMTPPILDLLIRRGDLFRPTVVTSIAGVETIPDTHLRRICQSLMRRVAPEPSPTSVA